MHREAQETLMERQSQPFADGIIAINPKCNHNPDLNAKHVASVPVLNIRDV